MKIKSLGLVLLILVSGCASLEGAYSDQQVARVQVGDSQAQVKSLLGQPDTVVLNHNESSWVYELVHKKEGPKELRVDFKDGAVVAVKRFDGRSPASADVVEGDVYPGTCTNWRSKLAPYEPRCHN